MDKYIILIMIGIYGYYWLYKLILESNMHYLFWLIFNGLIIIGSGFVIHFPRRVFYIVETAGILYLLLVIVTVILHIDIIEKIRDYFK